MIPFNKPYLTGKEMHYMYQAVYSGKISGNGVYTQKCQKYFQNRYGIKKALLTTSCTDALEMCALLIDIKPGDEVIVPSYTFVSTALAFARQGAKIVFADSREDHPGMDEKTLEELITPRTKAIVPVHYAGIACDMDKVMALAKRYNLIVVEDAAQAIEANYKGRPLGSIGHLAAFSFHETKNVISGEGGLLAINDDRFIDRSEIIWEKGTNRAEFFRGEVNKYEWIDTGSSFLPSEITAAFLWAQLENLEDIQAKRKAIWNTYHSKLQSWANHNDIKQPQIPSYAGNNAHMYYLCFESLLQRQRVIEQLKDLDIQAVSHYLSLHDSKYYRSKNYEIDRTFPMSDRYTDCLLRLPLYYELSKEDQQRIIEALKSIRLQPVSSNGMDKKVTADSNA
ncbi:dTDP-4-amino-4,6-dideoxygalactose transaminase [Aliifodinibius salipaludis]|uniref:dTDP-4-amino-4,6-dideoxygalactose transaminase n=1 Tax=Fodinibius salipaludis TaxID=2032627 RepID=A0A2A2GAW6_9BACT|nr:dTDP-4-amino-4,6-dideoxygalactose transaminase [Aliifodinibius salipaludis]PAU94003.1 dTDP-4-amino-4,6-dideoxygalactose transaminase [Aliifodinibius salipaludis]